MSEDCALCTDAEAITEIETPAFFAGLAVWKCDIDAPHSDVVVPLCEDCRDRIDAVTERYNLDAEGGERAARADLEDLAAALDDTVLNAASQ